MTKQSAGILPFRFVNDEIFFFIVHPGGPFFKNKDNGFWGIAKGEFSEDENPLSAAKREFYEETNNEIKGDFIELPTVTLKSGKVLHAWAVEVMDDFIEPKSNSFTIQWPPKSGAMKNFPEVDAYKWCNLEQVSLKMSPGQFPLIQQLLAKLNISGSYAR